MYHDPLSYSEERYQTELHRVSFLSFIPVSLVGLRCILLSVAFMETSEFARPFLLVINKVTFLNLLTVTPDLHAPHS